MSGDRNGQAHFQLSAITVKRAHYISTFLPEFPIPAQNGHIPVGHTLNQPHYMTKVIHQHINKEQN